MGKVPGKIFIRLGLDMLINLLIEFPDHFFKKSDLFQVFRKQKVVVRGDLTLS